MFLTSPDQAEDLVRSWIEHPALRQLIEADGGTWPSGDLQTVVAQLVAFSRVWDRRNGESRLVFKDDEESRIDERAQLVYQSAEELGLINPAPPTLTRPDYLLILGGLATGVEPRVRYAAELITSQTVRTDYVAALASFREIFPKERPAADRFAPDARFEIDLFTAILDDAFPTSNRWTTTLVGDPRIDSRRAESRRKREGWPLLASYAARSTAADTRIANTADTYAQFANDVNLVERASSVLIITSTIYRPFQHMDAVRVLGPFGATVETVGVPSSGNNISHPPSAFLQEVRSGIRSSQHLLANRTTISPK